MKKLKLAVSGFFFFAGIFFISMVIYSLFTGEWNFYSNCGVVGIIGSTAIQLYKWLFD